MYEESSITKGIPSLDEAVMICYKELSYFKETPMKTIITNQTLTLKWAKT